jgi:predicted RNase H-like nuclease (RuvC/YqgF family)
MDADPERRLVELRRERFFVRSQLKVLRRTRERQAAAGATVAASDERLAALERELAGLDAAVERLRARLGRPHRTPPGTDGGGNQVVDSEFT